MCSPGKCLPIQASFNARETALAEAERLRSENVNLVRRLVLTKEREAERMNEINKQHDVLVSWKYLDGFEDGPRWNGVMDRVCAQQGRLQVQVKAVLNRYR